VNVGSVSAGVLPDLRRLAARAVFGITGPDALTELLAAAELVAVVQLVV
jgi:hypothetical protein